MRSLLQKKLKVVEIVGRLGRKQTGEDPNKPGVGAGGQPLQATGKPRPIFEFEIIVFTGADENAGTDPKVYLTGVCVCVCVCVCVAEIWASFWGGFRIFVLDFFVWRKPESGTGRWKLDTDHWKWVNI